MKEVRICVKGRGYGVAWGRLFWGQGCSMESVPEQSSPRLAA